MNSDINLEDVATRIAVQILAEEFQISDDEKEKQSDVAAKIDKRDLRASEKDKKETITDEAEEEEEEEEEDIEAKPKPDTEDEDKSGGDFEVQAPDAIPDNVHFSQIEKQINNLRAGKSLKDEKISKQLEDYFDTLGQAEERALFTFLASISAILTGGTEGSEAPRPESLGLSIDMPKKKKSDKAAPGDPGGPMDHAAPIVVGEAANKYAELAIVLENFTSSDKHRCLDGQIVDFGSSSCILDIDARINDMGQERDMLKRGSADRSSLNGALKYLRQKKRTAVKIQKQDEEEDVQSKLDLADSA